MNASQKNSNERAITGIQAMQGQGVQRSLGFWADAWSQVTRRRGAVFAMSWLAIVGFFAVFAPLLASGHPLIFRRQTEDGVVTTWPLFSYMSAPDWLLLIGTLVGVIWVALPLKRSRGARIGNMIWAGVQAAVITVTLMIISGVTGRRDAPDWVRSMEQWTHFVPVACASVALAWTVIFMLLPAIHSLRRRLAVSLLTGAVTCVVAIGTWTQPPETWPYLRDIGAGRAEAVFTIVPWSPQQALIDRNTKLLPPGTTSAEPLAEAVARGAGLFFMDRPLTLQQRDAITRSIEDLGVSQAEQDVLISRWQPLASSPEEITGATMQRALQEGLRELGSPFYLGTDSRGQDVLSQMIHAARLAISIGLVSTGIATLIGVTIGAIMGYFGGVIDLLLYRVVEVFMAVPVLFLLIVAAGVLPPELRSTYVMMAIIGVFTWHGAARFTRAEFFKLRNQDFVQSARAVGLPLRSILFRHMLPNGVAPVLVDASFLIASAILFETILSYLGLGPPNQASWGRLLSDASSESGGFKWWLATFPGFVIFLTVLSYNLIGEAFQMAIDPKLRKARV